jgi:leucyl/phenylalanyl-tRNA--protein transferase
LIPWLGDTHAFPPLARALKEPNGLLAAGGDLGLERLLAAYRRGIFPWYSEDEPILWWSPDPRMVLFPAELKVSRSLAKTLRKGRFTITADRSFREVIEGCSGPRNGQRGTWITPEMIEAYCGLHDAGYAHSIEAWLNDRLAGGLYGVALGRAFFGESMFTHVTDASKVAFVALVRQLHQWQFGLIDCQMKTSHLASFGAREIPRTDFARRLSSLVDYEPTPGPWHIEPVLDLT